MVTVDESNELARTEYPKFPKANRPPAVLVVEDDPMQVLVWQTILNSLEVPATIDWACSEELGEVIFSKKLQNEEHFDLVIADIMLPGSKNGIDLWRKFGEQTETPFLFVSGILESTFKELSDGDPTGPFFLNKPFQPAEAKRLIENLLAFPRAEVTIRRTT